METDYRELIEFPMSKLNDYGIFCLIKPSKGRKLFTTFFGCLTFFNVIMSVVQFFYITNNIFDFVDNTEALAGYGQILLKLCFSAYNKEKFMKLIKISQQFWTTKNSSTNLEKETATIVRIIKLFQRIIFCLFLSTTAIFTGATFFGKKLPVGSWNMENQEQLYRIVWLNYVITLPFVMYFLSSFDGLFLGLCYEIIIQFKILRDRLESLSVMNIQSQEEFEVFYQKLRKNIQYHMFLLNFIKEMQDVYSIPFMLQYLTISPLICTEIYITSDSTVLPLTLRYGFGGCCLIVQLGFYCIAASFIFEEAMLVSYGIYNSDWYSKYFRKMQNPMVMMIQASQTELQFRACGLVPININTLVSVVKVAFSLSAVFKSMKE